MSDGNAGGAMARGQVNVSGFGPSIKTPVWASSHGSASARVQQRFRSAATRTDSQGQVSLPGAPVGVTALGDETRHDVGGLFKPDGRRVEAEVV